MKFIRRSTKDKSTIVQIKMKHRGITLTELVVVLAIIAIVGLISFPSFSRARESARELVCKNNLRQMNLALMDYVQVAGIPGPNQTGGIDGWCIEILPLLEQRNLHANLPIGSPITDLPSEYFELPNVFRCPTQELRRRQPAGEIAFSHYVLIAEPNEKRKTFRIADAPSTLEVPWVLSPEFQRLSEIVDGPHNNGYFWIPDYVHGVGYTRF